MCVGGGGQIRRRKKNIVEKDIWYGGGNGITLESDLSLKPSCVSFKLGSWLGQLSYP